MSQSHTSIAPPAASRVSRGVRLWIAGLGAALLLAVLALIQPQTAGAIVPPTSQTELDVATAAWAANGPSDYMMSYRTICSGCTNHVVVTVGVENDGLISAVTHVGSPISVVGVGNPEIFDIPGLFAKIQFALDNGTYVQAFFDPVNGRPTNVSFNYAAPMATPILTTHSVFGYLPGTSAASCLNRDVTVVLTENGDFFDAAGLGTGGGNMVIAGLAGDDTITTYGTRDFICAGDGNDTTRTGDGNDFVAGNNGNDSLFGERGDDRLLGGDGQDKLFGQAGADDLKGGAAADMLYGGVGADVIDGGGGTDRIWGGDGWDQLWGGSGPDRIWGGAGFDMIEGEEGNDRLYGGNHADELHAGPGNDFARGNGGNDLVNGEVGDDIVWGDSGNDLLYGADGDDDLDGGLGSDSCFPGAGTNTTTNC